jgi:aromatic ring-opening dioxygenase catalytic subunit (LigB family)
MQPTLFINHGGGPCFFLEPGPMRSAWAELEGHLSGLMETLDERPSAILMISGHWDEEVPTVTSHSSPSPIYDYQGFPPHTYQLTWPAPGSPGLAKMASELLGDAGIASAMDANRGWDHGVFVPCKVMMPEADIPLVQLSMKGGFDPADHLAIGRALKPLRSEGVLIVGSGQSYHNIGGLIRGDSGDEAAEGFDKWLREAMLDENGRDSALERWFDAPHARLAHPHEDHLVPLMVAAGAASGEPAAVNFQGHALGKPLSGFRFG